MPKVQEVTSTVESAVCTPKVNEVTISSGSTSCTALEHIHRKSMAVIERRIDPADGEQLTWGEFRQKYEKKYNLPIASPSPGWQLEHHWVEVCQLVTNDKETPNDKGTPWWAVAGAWVGDRVNSIGKNMDGTTTLVIASTTLAIGAIAAAKLNTKSPADKLMGA